MGHEGSKDMEHVKGYTYFWIALQTICAHFIPIGSTCEFLFSWAVENTELLFKRESLLVQRVASLE